MKNNTLFAALFFIIYSSFAQKKETVKYAKLEDNPGLVADKIIALTVNSQFGKNTSTTIGVEGNALAKIQNNISVFGSLNYGVYNSSDFLSFDIETGGLFKFRTKDKVKGVKIVTKWSDHSSTSVNYNKGTETTTRETSMTYLDDKAIYRKEMSIRGGVFSSRAAEKYSSGSLLPNTPLTQVGIFGGIEHSTKAAVITSINNKKGITSGLTRLYADALIIPIDRSNKASNGFGVGGRAGFCIYMLPNKSRNAKPESLDARQAYGGMFFKSELGVKPTQGWFFMMGTGIMLYKNK